MVLKAARKRRYNVGGEEGMVNQNGGYTKKNNIETGYSVIQLKNIK